MLSSSLTVTPVAAVVLVLSPVTMSKPPLQLKLWTVRTLLAATLPLTKLVNALIAAPVAVVADAEASVVATAVETMVVTEAEIAVETVAETAGKRASIHNNIARPMRGRLFYEFMGECS